ncbi:MAG: hypothetical protein ACMUIS_04845 [bacterium]
MYGEGRHGISGFCLFHFLRRAEAVISGHNTVSVDMIKRDEDTPRDVDVNRLG